MRTIVKAFSSACVGAAGVLVAGCGAAPGAAGAESTGDVENAAQALSTEGQVCVTVQRGAGPASVADAVLWQNAPSWNDGAGSPSPGRLHITSRSTTIRASDRPRSTRW
ncbi:MAG TPA: hypothetical protein VL242_29340 [Sorangium sp.]|nr:hypothetical protein [Sorangium sp.]